MSYLARTIIAEARAAKASPARKKSSTPHPVAAPAAEPDPLPADAWPEPLADEAYHGLAGELVRMIEPHTEADPVALLVQAIVAFGNLVGRKAHFRAEADKHYANLFSCLVGQTAKGRKGTSWSHVGRVLGAVDEDWSKLVRSGLSSGEGLIWAVRDPVTAQEAVREGRGRESRVVDYQDVVKDAGVEDRRLLSLESEFASVLKVAARERNTLSAVVRQAWDTGSLNTLTKTAPAQATGAHISIIGHITRDELRRQIADVDLANGLANRFLWICVRRSKVLPDGGEFHRVDFQAMLNRLTDAADFARTTEQVRRDEGAKEIWHSVYPSLSEGKLGLLGAATSRAEAQTMRLALVYALLDSSTVIRAEHLLAALAVWTYCEQSAAYIFGSALGDPTADELLRAIRAAGDDGMTRTDIRDHFSRNKSSEEITRALESLAEAGLVRPGERPSEGIRPIEVWFVS